jgi:hypothetical protein
VVSGGVSVRGLAGAEASAVVMVGAKAVVTAGGARQEDGGKCRKFNTLI